MGFFKNLFNGPTKSDSEASRLLDLASALHVGATEPMSPLMNNVTKHFQAKGKNSVGPDDLFNEIQAIYKEALILAQQNNERNIECTILFNLGRLCQDPPKKRLFLDNPMKTLEAHLDQMGEDLRTGNYAKYASDDDAMKSRQFLAISYYQEALKQARVTANITVEACCLLNIATVYRFLCDAQQHGIFLQQAKDKVHLVADNAMRIKIIKAIDQELSL
jgi:hypothetical protein